MILTTSFNKIAQLHKRIRIVQGSSSASKTYSILQKLVLQAEQSEENKLVSIVTDTNVNVSKGAFRDFENIIEDRKLELKGTKHPIEYQINNWTFEFFGLDDSRKAKGGRRDILFLNEGNRVKWETARQLIMRTRDVVYIDYNPDCDFWADERYIGNDDVDFCIVTYLDNEACPQTAIDEIESYKETDPEWYKVFGLGIKGDLYKGKVFPKWEEIEQFPELDDYWYGLDFGFSNDPTAIIKTVTFRGKIYLDEVLYQTGLTNADIAKLLKESGYNGAPVICDSAEPKSIVELQLLGVNAIGADKRAGSIMAGIDFLKRSKVLVTSRSSNIIKENKHYKWKQDRDGKHLNQPLDWMNHCFDENTQIETESGFKSIKEINNGEYILTSFGYNKVISNGITGYNKIFEYTIYFSNFVLKLKCTDNHLIYTNKGWIQISNLVQGMTVFLSKHLMAKHTGYIREKLILAEEENAFILNYGNTLTEKYQEVLTSIIKMETRLIMLLKTLKLFKVKYTKKNTEKKERLNFLSGLLIFKQRELKRRKFGIKAKPVENGINNTQLKSILAILHTVIKYAKCVILTLLQILNIKDFVQIDAKVNTEEITKQTTLQQLVNIAANNLHTPNIQNKDIVQSRVVQKVESKFVNHGFVYDLTIDKNSEFFANGLLVHNSIDAIRYAYSIQGFSGKEESVIVNYSDL